MQQNRERYYHSIHIVWEKNKVNNFFVVQVLLLIEDMQWKESRTIYKLDVFFLFIWKISFFWHAKILEKNRSVFLYILEKCKNEENHDFFQRTVHPNAFETDSSLKI